MGLFSQAAAETSTLPAVMYCDSFSSPLVDVTYLLCGIRKLTFVKLIGEYPAQSRTFYEITRI